MSLYAEYLRERTADEIMETNDGFITYRYMDEGIVYIVDLYVVPAFRQKRVASEMADSVVALAKKRGCTKLLGSVVPSNKDSTTSLKVLLGYGMHLKSSSHDFIIFEKDI